MGPVILDAEIMHARPGRSGNKFRYGAWYLGLPLSGIDALPRGLRFAINRPALVSVQYRDHGARDGSDLNAWVQALLEQEGLSGFVQEVTLVAMPRVFGYGFNPVSFWLCSDSQGELRAVLCEVNNTYGETHTYLCRHEDGRAIRPEDRLYAEKCFHVSPFLERGGRYEFRFAVSGDELDIGIRHLAEDGSLRLTTAVRGQLQPFSMGGLRRVFWRHLMVPFKAWLLIHWQALKLARRGFRFREKPEQVLPRISLTRT